MIGKKFGDWEVVSEEPQKGPFKLWLCRCKCGTEKTYTTSCLNSSGNSFCCINCRAKLEKEKLIKLQKQTIGKTYGSYTVLKYAGKNKSNSKLWLCQCLCGHKRIFMDSYLYGNGDRRATQCIKCYKKEMDLSSRTTEAIPHRFWKRFSDHTTRRGIEVKITKEEAFGVYLKQNKKCALSGTALYFSKFSVNFNRYTNASIDRINSDLPYTISNIQWVHKEINIMKWRFSQKKFLDWCSKIAHFKGRKEIYENPK